MADYDRSLLADQVTVALNLSVSTGALVMSRDAPERCVIRSIVAMPDLTLQNAISSQLTEAAPKAMERLTIGEIFGSNVIHDPHENFS